MKKLFLNIFINGLQEITNNSFIQLKKFKNKIFHSEILVLGDSHAEVFKYLLFSEKFPKYFFNVVSVGGATASGLENPNSKTQSNKLFESALRKYKGDKVILMLGEVDTGFVIWYRANKYNDNVYKMAETAQRNYKRLIKNISNKFSLIVISTPLPTIADENNWGTVANKRKDVTASQLERTKLTIDFNKNIQYFCIENNIIYINLDKECIASNGLVNKKFLNEDPSNHHFNQEEYSKILIMALTDVI